jgi:hypothetical protein
VVVVHGTFYTPVYTADNPFGAPGLPTAAPLTGGDVFPAGMPMTGVPLSASAAFAAPPAAVASGVATSGVGIETEKARSLAWAGTLC